MTRLRKDNGPPQPRPPTHFRSATMLERCEETSGSSIPACNEARFAALWNRTVIGGPASAKAVFARLARFYGEPHRHYHTLGHIWRCLEEFDRAVELMDNPDAVEMALWFHDAIYVSGAGDNEWRSADLFRQWSEGYADPVFGKRVGALIMVTTHRESPTERDQRFIVDIDLSSFGLPWDEFERDGRHIRAECADRTDEEYFPGHLRFLLALLNRPAIYFTDYFHRRYEQIARANAQRVVADLRARGYGGV